MFDPDDNSYEVQPGDTLSQLASKLGSKNINQAVQDIAKLNKIQNPNQIQAGQRLRLPDAPASNRAPKFNPMNNAPVPPPARMPMGRFNEGPGLNNNEMRKLQEAGFNNSLPSQQYDQPIGPKPADWTFNTSQQLDRIPSNIGKAALGATMAAPSLMAAPATIPAAAAMGALGGAGMGLASSGFDNQDPMQAMQQGAMGGAVGGAGGALLGRGIGALANRPPMPQPQQPPSLGTLQGRSILNQPPRPPQPAGPQPWEVPNNMQPWPEYATPRAPLPAQQPMPRFGDGQNVPYLDLIDDLSLPKRVRGQLPPQAPNEVRGPTPIDPFADTFMKSAPPVPRRPPNPADDLIDPQMEAMLELQRSPAWQQSLMMERQGLGPNDTYANQINDLYLNEAGPLGGAIPFGFTKNPFGK